MYSAASSPGEPHPSKLPLTPSYPLHQFRELMGRESPGEVLRSLIESPLAVPEEVFAALPRLRSTYSTAAPSSPCFIRHRRRKARHPPYPSHNSERVEGAREAGGEDRILRTSHCRVFRSERGANGVRRACRVRRSHDYPVSRTAVMFVMINAVAHVARHAFQMPSFDRCFFVVEKCRKDHLLCDIITADQPRYSLYKGRFICHYSILPIFIFPRAIPANAWTFSAEDGAATPIK